MSCWEVMEQWVCGKKDADHCEDGIVMTDNYAAVIDGSTSKTPFRLQEAYSNGKLCMLEVSKFIRQAPADLTAEQFCQGVTEHIHALYGSFAAQVEAHKEQRLCASAIVVSRHRSEVWMVGDCHCLINNTHHDNPKPQEAGQAQRRAAIWQDLFRHHPELDNGQPLEEDPARQAIIPDIVDKMAGQNVRYAVIDGFPIFMPGVKVIKLPTTSPAAEGTSQEAATLASSAPEVTFQEATSSKQEAVVEVVLASDGYPILYNTLDATERTLQKIIHADPHMAFIQPECKGWMKGQSSFDDRSYLRLRL